MLATVLVCAVVGMDLNMSFVTPQPGIEKLLLLNAPNIFLFVIFSVLILNSLGRKDDLGFRAPLRSQDWTYLGWLVLVTLSAMWSVSPTFTLRSVAPLAVVWLATLFLHRLSLVDAVKIVVGVAAVTALLSLIAVPLLGGGYAYQPVSSTGAPELRGILQHQLRLGALMALALGLLVVAKFNGDWARIRAKSSLVNFAVIGLIVGVLFLSRARLYVGDAAIALLLTVILARRGSRKLIASLVLVVVGLFVAMDFNSLLAKLEGLGFDTTLTGRTAIWTRALNGITEDSWWLGHGFGTFRLSEFDQLFAAKYRASHAHSSYIQALFETGMLGLAALIVLIVVQFVVAWRYSIRCNTYSYSLFLVLYAALGSATGLNYAGTLSAIFGVMLMFLAIESRITSTSSSADPVEGQKNSRSPG